MNEHLKYKFKQQGWTILPQQHKHHLIIKT
jgi:hypothetical protein